MTENEVTKGHFDIGGDRLETFDMPTEVGMNEVARDILKAIERDSDDKHIKKPHKQLTDDGNDIDYTEVDDGHPAIKDDPAPRKKRKGNSAGLKKAWEARKQQAKVQTFTAHNLFVDMLRGYLTYLEQRGSWTSVTTTEGEDEVTIVVRMDKKAGK